MRVHTHPDYTLIRIVGRLDAILAARTAIDDYTGSKSANSCFTRFQCTSGSAGTTQLKTSVRGDLSFIERLSQVIDCRQPGPLAEMNRADVWQPIESYRYIRKETS